MPLFEYRCENKACDHRFERLVGHTERDKPQECPKCKAKHTQKLISQTSFALKGGGWAADGYAS